MQLFCFTFAGGTAAFFNQLESACKEKIEFVKLDYPGHGERYKEKLCDTIQSVVELLYDSIKEQYNGGGYGLMGYSMGSITAFEMLQYITLKGEMPLPKHIFLAAHEPRAVIELTQIKKDELDDYVRQRTIDFGAVPEKLIDNKSFWRMYLPLYKADYLMIGRYDFDKVEYKTEIPATVFYSENDTPLSRMKGWEKYFSNRCEFVQYSGTHFFINDHYNEMANDIIERLGNE